MRKSLLLAAGAGAMFVAGLVAGPVSAQTTQATQTTTTQTTRTQAGDVVGPHNPYCGAWVDGTFQANGNCVVETTVTTTTTNPSVAPMAGSTAVVATPNRFNERVTGKIIMVNKNMVTLQHGDTTLVVDDSRALDRMDTGRVATGREIIAHGYWEDGTFYASRFE